MKYKQQISTLGLFMAAVGCIVGSGWLFGPLYAAKLAGPGAIISWALGGLMMMLIALTFAELASRYPMPGGMVRYAHLSHGPLVSFAIAWVTWLASVTVAPVETLALLQYASNYMPGLMTKGNSHQLTLLGISCAAAVMLLLCLFNGLGAKWFSKSNTSIVLWKLFIPIIAIVFLFHLHFDPANFKGHGGFLPFGMHGVLKALPSAGIVFSFIGYSGAIQLGGEAKNPHRALPIAIIGALGFGILLYVLLQTAFIAALPRAAFSHGWSQLHFAGDAGPLAGILGSLGAIWLVKLLYLDAIISPFGTAYIYTAATARTTHALAENRQLSTKLTTLNKNGIPMRAMLVNFIVGLIFFLPFPGWQAMVGFLVSCFVLCYAVGPLSLICLRRKDPGNFPCFRLPYSRVSCLLAFYCCNLILFWTGWDTISKMLGLLLVGYIFFFTKKYIRLRDMPFDWHNLRWLVPYLSGMGIISYLGSFGHGTRQLAFGWDFLVVGILSVTVFYLATGKSVEQAWLMTANDDGSTSNPLAQ